MGGKAPHHLQKIIRENKPVPLAAAVLRQKKLERV